MAKIITGSINKQLKKGKDKEKIESANFQKIHIYSII